MTANGVRVPTSKVSLAAQFSQNDLDQPCPKKDLIQQLIEKETYLQCSSGEYFDTEIKPLNRPSGMMNPNSSNQSNGAYKVQESTIEAQKIYEQLLNTSSFSQNLNDTSSQPLKLPLQNTDTDRNLRITEFHNLQRSQLMMLLDFSLEPLEDLGGFLEQSYGSEQDLNSYILRQITQVNQEYVDSNITFKINGVCHSQKVFQQDLIFNVSGKKVVASIQ
jgi:hypothetical protein